MTLAETDSDLGLGSPQDLFQRWKKTAVDESEKVGMIAA